MSWTGGNHRVQVFTLEGDFLRQFGRYGNGDGELNTPAGIATVRNVPGSGVWVADTRNNRIVQFSVAGRFLKAIDCAACPLGRFAGPVGIALHKVPGSYRIFVSEELAGRVRVVTPEGSQVGSIGFRGSAKGDLAIPTTSRVDADATLFVAKPEMRIDASRFSNRTVRSFASSAKSPICWRIPWFLRMRSP